MHKLWVSLNRTCYIRIIHVTICYNISYIVPYCCSWEHVGEYFENLELLEPIGKLWEFDARIVRTFWEFGGNTLRTPK